ncbi:MAG: hypothetical protein FWC76_02725 [Defluviitaleaceae bacterium]|nr:hypothetical protein [Defluviitaleaceae bacterium]
MAYVTQNFYKKVYGGKGKSEDLKGLIEAASVLIDALTHNRIQAVGFKNLTAFQQGAVKKSCCLMVDHMVQNGVMPGAEVDSFSLHDMRVAMRRRRQRPWDAVGCGMWAWLTLLQTGLMRGSLI